MGVRIKKGVSEKSLVIGSRVGHSVSVYADSFGYAHIYIREKKTKMCGYPDFSNFLT